MATVTEIKNETERVAVADWVGFLFGGRQAIEAIARSRGAIWVGLLFVLSAGLAREYDGAYLLREPWHFFVPLVASIGTSLFLYALVYCAAHCRGVADLPWWPGYRTLLTFYWMTAPLAWIYAIPVERFLDPPTATTANFYFLAIVSIWRVFLISRVFSVWLNARFWEMLLIVLFFANSVATVLAFVTPTPVWDVMGGIRLPERESIILSLKLGMWFYGTMSWIVLGIIAVYVMWFRKTPWSLAAVPSDHASPIGLSIWSFAVILLLIGLCLLPLAQGEQKLRWQAERLLRSGQIAEGLQSITQHPREAFPPHWDLPPRTSYGEREPDLDKILIAMETMNSPTWLREIYLEKLLSDKSALTGVFAAAAEGNSKRLSELIGFMETDIPLKSLGGEFPWTLRELRANNSIDADLRERIDKYLDQNSDEVTVD
jgi:hypothetical protein